MVTDKESLHKLRKIDTKLREAIEIAESLHASPDNAFLSWNFDCLCESFYEIENKIDDLIEQMNK